MTRKKSKYELLGIDSSKAGIRRVFKGVVSNEYPGAWCNIITDPWDHTGKNVVTKHSDGSGSKSLQRLLDYLKHGKPEIFQDDILDALGMNTGDVACSGFTRIYLVTDVVAINAANAPKDVITQQLAIGMAKVKALYSKHGIELIFFGGETADLPDQTRSYILDVDVFSRTLRESLIKGNVKRGDVIFGLASDGQAEWEEEENSGIMSNGLTLGRKGVLHAGYCEEFPFIADPAKPFFGEHQIDTPVDGTKMTVSQALLSPTRQWCIVIKMLMDQMRARDTLSLLHGISMNTGGGASKVKNLGRGIVYKKKMPPPPPFFRFIQEATGETWENMYRSFNMGVGLDIVGDPADGILEKTVSLVSHLTGVKSFHLGECAAARGGKNQVKLQTDFGNYKY